MTTIAYLSGKLPSGDANGLAAVVRELVDDPTRVHVVIALVDTVKVVRVVESGQSVPTVRIRRVEAIGDPGDADQLKRLLAREFERRTGQAVLPLDLERDVADALEHTDDQPDAGGSG